jgi:hypothetical protein
VSQWCWWCVPCTQTPLPHGHLAPAVHPQSSASTQQNMCAKSVNGSSSCWLLDAATASAGATAARRPRCAACAATTPAHRHPAAGCLTLFRCLTEELTGARGGGARAPAAAAAGVLLAERGYPVTCVVAATAVGAAVVAAATAAIGPAVPAVSSGPAAAAAMMWAGQAVWVARCNDRAAAAAPRISWGRSTASRQGAVLEVGLAAGPAADSALTTTQLQVSDLV